MTRLLPRFSPVALVAAVLFVATNASAQFDDEFNDEFNDGFDDSANTEAESETEQRSGGFDDGGFDEFGDSEFADSEFTDLENETPPDLEEEEAEPEEESENIRARLMRAQNTYLGPVGGLHVVDASGGAEGSFRLQLLTDFFFTSDFIAPGDEADHIGGSLSLSATVHDYIELWISLQSFANSNTTGDPSLFQVLGDAQFGIKAFAPITPWLTVGGDLSVNILNTVGDIGLVFNSTGFGIRANATADLRGLPNSIPFIARLNVQYEFNNSSKLIEDTETARYNSLPDPRPRDMGEDRHLITPVERFGLNINRTDFLNLALGVEVPLRVMEDFYIQPLVEYTWGIPINRQGYDCPLAYDPSMEDGPPAGVDDCRADAGIAADPMTVTIAARILPPVDGLSFTLGADIGLTGVNTIVRELAPNAPYNLYLGLAYAYDTQPAPVAAPEIREVERVVEVEGELPLMGRIAGQVVEQGAGTPISGATIQYNGHDLTGQLTSADGRFVSYQFEPGEVAMTITHPDYNGGQCAATIPDERPEGDAELVVEVRCELVALPRVGQMEGTVESAEGGAVSGATVTLSGPASRTATTSGTGRFTLGELPPGEYTVRVEAEEFLIKTQSVTVVARETVEPEIAIIPRPRRALVRVRARDIQIRRQINFATDSAEIQPTSEPLMAEIADVLLRNPDITRVEIQGHTDNRGRSQANMTLSQNRANSVRAWLIEAGVNASRLEARGYGDTEPLVPNITSANRARNRRVQFIIQERTESTDSE